MAQNDQKVWLVTGASTGLGKALVLALIESKQKVIATARNPHTIQDYLPEEYDTDNLLILALDVTKQEQIKTTVEEGLRIFGRIDVLVNNAGYAYFSPIEGADDQKIKQMFAVNFWGIKHLTDEVLPIMREQQSGSILNISSLGGLRAFAGFGYYHASKFALEGYSETLYQEVKPLGISIMLVEPGDFRTDFAGRSAIKNEAIPREYQSTSGQNIMNIKELSGHQPGNPDLAAKVMIDVVKQDELPSRLLLGTDAYNRALEKIKSMQSEFEEWQHVTKSTDY